LVAEDTSGATDVGSALVAEPAFSRVSSGFSEASDGWTDLRGDHRMDWNHTSATDGNVVQIGQLARQGSSRTIRATLALGFGASGDAALTSANASLKRAFPAVRDAYEEGWARYLESLDAAPASVADAALRTQYDAALMTLKAHEDKTYPGANIASLTVPWGQAINADEEGVGGYHLVWSRDLYQVATAQLAAGDEAAAHRSLDYLFGVQQRPDGSFPQNTLLDGTPYWGSLQMDEVAFPIVLAGQLGRFDAETWEHVKLSADFIVRRGPSTPQERWEEEGGYSPSTIAAQIAGLVTAAEIARRNGDQGAAALYTGVADDWQRRVEEWTFTTTGPIGDGEYFVRIDDNGDPDDGGRLDINNGGGNWDEREIVDGGFLDLVRLGVRPADDPSVLASLPELDGTIKVETPHGAMWYRYNNDGYGEKADGRPYDGTGVGRLWPLLTGERGEYELAAGRSADRHLRTMAGASNEGWMIPEQVWDRPDAFGFEFGEGTGSATPLAWSIAQFVRLALSIDAGSPVETPSLVAGRYADGPLPAGPALDVTSPAPGAQTAENSADVTGTTDGAEVWVHAGGETVAAELVDGEFSLRVPLERGRNSLTVVAVDEDGSTSTVQRTVVSLDFGTPVGAFDDPAGDDDGPGTYVYPTNGVFSPGVFDVTRLAVYEDGDQVNVVVTLDGEVSSPWGGNAISLQRFDVYLRSGSGSGTVPALIGTNAQLAAPYDRVITADGWDSGVADAGGNDVGAVTLTAIPESRQVVVTVPAAALGSVDPATAEYALTMMSHADPNGEGVGGIRPVYDRQYWESTRDTDMWWIREYRFGGGAGVFDGGTAARDTDTRDPNVLDVLVPAGSSQVQVLDWTAGAPVTLPYVTLG
jgi:glucan 1,4-alpha-glucosidase